MMQNQDDKNKLLIDKHHQTGQSISEMHFSESKMSEND